MALPSLPWPVRLWLLACCALIFVMVLLGAITRLTGAGLSITAWEPVSGAVPPLSEAAWRRAFAAYQAIPQYRLLHDGMALETFKTLFFWEWLHRLWGRLIGLAFALPLALFLLRRTIGAAWGLRLAAILALGGLQGFVGWFMVQSGLTEGTSVNPLRLALHLDFALLLYALLLWVALPAGPPLSPSLRRQGWLTLAVLALTLTWGALVAGLQAGTIYTTWPLMDGVLVPAAVTDWPHPLDNPVLAQLVHRWLGPLVLVLVLAWVRRLRRAGRRGALPLALAAMALVQVGLGVATLLSGAALVMAVLHQAGAVLLLSLLVATLRRGLPCAAAGHRSPPAPGPGHTR